jgi:rhodanese-related sulfurtransferase
MSRSVDAKTVKGWLSDGGEIAFLDVREAGPFADGHPFFAIPLPYSRLEADIERVVPNRGVRVVLTDAGDGVAERAAKRAEALGYTNVTVMTGGAPAWKAAGYTLYEGVNLPSKTFGEIVEHARHTPRISAPELQAMRTRGDDFVLVDGRTWAEYTRFNVPGGISCPNGELVLRIGKIAPDPKTTIVVNCAGRTRSIIGAQTLIDFGVPNKVVALENGTQGWFLAGFQVEKGADRRWPDAPADESVRDGLRLQAQRHGEHHGVRVVSADEVVGWLGDAARTAYVLDVRTAEEFAAGTLPGAVHAPGGQLIQATDQWVGVKGARIAVMDGELIRAPMVAAWLRQLGHDANVLDPGARTDTALASALSARKPRAGDVLPKVKAVTLQEVERGGVQVIDLRTSAAWSAGHIPGSVWSIRPRIAAAAGKAPVVLVADETMVARAAARDLADAGAGDVGVLEGGVSAWTAGGRKLDAAPDQPPAAERIDFVFHTHGRHEGNAEAARAYLAWETGLLDQLDEQERSVFRLGAG